MVKSREFAQPTHHIEAIYRNNDESNPVVTPYKHSEAKVFYDRNGIVIEKRPVRLADGMRYDVLSSRLTKSVPEGLEGLAYEESVAFCTRPEGLYVKRLIKMGELGIAGTVISAPQNFGKLFTFDENAHNHLSVMHNEAVEFGRDPDFITVGGISQGAMYGNGILDLAHEHDTTVLAAHLGAPCLPNGLSPSDILETLEKAPNELKAFGSFTKMGMLALLRMGPTADLTPEALYVQLQCLPALLSGRTGEHARNINPDVLVAVEVFLGDCLSRGRTWRDTIYNDKPNVKVFAKEGGAHLNCVDNESQSSWLAFQAAIATTLRENPRIRSDKTTAAKILRELITEQYPQYGTNAA